MAVTLRKLLAFSPQAPRSLRPRALFQPLVEELENRLAPATTLHVGSMAGEYPTIQAAVTAAGTGPATIRVDPGTYAEQVTFGPSQHDIVLTGAGNGVTIKAPAVMAAPKAIVEVHGAQRITITNVTIAGPGPGPSDSIEAGIRIDSGGSATITNDHITQIEDNPLSGGQEPVGIEVGRASETTTGSAIISHNIIDNYQKEGIFVDNVGSNAVIDHNTITGIGPTSVVAQNGIQISSGATAQIDHNTISQNIFDVPDSSTAAIGIDLFDAGAVTMDHNDASYNDIGIYVAGGTPSTKVSIDHNQANDNTFSGIVLDTTSGAVVSHNTTNDNGSDNPYDGGIVLFNASNNVIDHNDSRNNFGDGILVSGDTPTSSSGNRFDDNHLKGNNNYDAEDQTTGTGTAGTANVWTKNHGKTSNTTPSLFASR